MGLVLFQLFCRACISNQKTMQRWQELVRCTDCNATVCSFGLFLLPFHLCLDGRIFCVFGCSTHATLISPVGPSSSQPFSVDLAKVVVALAQNLDLYGTERVSGDPETMPASAAGLTYTPAQIRVFCSTAPTGARRILISIFPSAR